jgi:hypothetical protein
MNSKLLVATAAIATSAAAIKIDGAKTTLAQSNDTGAAYAACHGTYAYQCIQEKVDVALDHMIQDLENIKQNCILTASELKGEIVDGVRDLRLHYQVALGEARAAAEQRLYEKLASATAAINAQLAISIELITNSAGDVTTTATSNREEIQNEIKKLYYSSQASGYHDQYKLKA